MRSALGAPGVDEGASRSVTKGPIHCGLEPWDRLSGAGEAGQTRPSRRLRWPRDGAGTLGGCGFEAGEPRDAKNAGNR